MTSGGDSACSLNVGIALLDRAEQILVPRQRQVGIVAALQQQLHAADGDRFVDLPEQLVEPEHVALGRSDRPVERAEVALRDADVRVVDVAVDDVGDDALGMLAGADAVGEPAEQRRRRVPIQLERFGGADASAAATFAAICSMVMTPAGTCRIGLTSAVGRTVGPATHARPRPYDSEPARQGCP